MTLYLNTPTHGKKEYNFCAGVDWHNRGQQINWCYNNLKKDEWYYFDHQGSLYFEHEKDLLWFKLRWPQG
jgi:hypothetical protein